MPHFECGAFNHSATSPGRTAGLRPGRYVAASASPDKGAVEFRCVIRRLARETAASRLANGARDGGRDRPLRPPYDPQYMALQRETALRIRRELRGIVLALLMVAVTTIVAYALTVTSTSVAAPSSTCCR